LVVMNPYIKAHTWLSKNSQEADKYEGMWIAVVEGRILGAAAKLGELRAQPAVREVLHPLFTKVPKPEEAYSILSGG
jgi:hypothetical protein